MDFMIFRNNRNTHCGGVMLAVHFSVMEQRKFVDKTTRIKQTELVSW